MNKIEKRDSDKYTRIENLNPYEFINCVAYELEMRKQNKESEIIYNETNGYILHGISISEIKITNKTCKKRMNLATNNGNTWSDKTVLFGH